MNGHFSLSGYLQLASGSETPVRSTILFRKKKDGIGEGSHHRSRFHKMLAVLPFVTLANMRILF